MNHLFTLVAVRGDRFFDVMPHIDGRAFSELIEAHELTAPLPLRTDLKFGTESGDAGIPVGDIDWLDDVPTVADRVPRTSEKVIALVCGCGYEGCGRTWVDLTVTEDEVIWSNVRTWITGYEPYPDFGPWVFDRVQYEAECERIARLIDSTRPES